MRSRLLCIVLAAILAATAALLGPTVAGAKGVAATPADSFVESIGVNTHLSYSDTPYGSQFQTVAQRLSELGVRHIREGLQTGRSDQYEALEALAAAGVHSTLILGNPGNSGEFADLISTLKTSVRGSVEAVEGPNEYDTRGGSGWAAALGSYQGRLHAAVKSDPALSGLPVYGPSVVQKKNEEALGDISGSLDYGNIHPYPVGDEPEDNVSSYLGRAALNGGSKPVVATETGYHNAIDWGGEQTPVSEAAAAIYMPRLFLDYYGEGISRTFSYELLDQGTDGGDREQNWGLLRNDLSPKPAFLALRNLIAITRDPGPAFTPETVDYDVGGDAEGLHQVLLQRHDGSFDLALWRAEPVWDPQTKSTLNVPATPVKLEFARSVVSAERFEPSVAATPLAAPAVHGGALSVPVGAGVTVLHLSLGAALPTGRISFWVSRRAVPVGGSVAVHVRLPRAVAGRPLPLEIQSWQPDGQRWQTVGHGRSTAAGHFAKAIRVPGRAGPVSRLRVVADVAKPSRPVRLRLTDRRGGGAPPVAIAFGHRALPN